MVADPRADEAAADPPVTDVPSTEGRVGYGRRGGRTPLLLGLLLLAALAAVFVADRYPGGGGIDPAPAPVGRLVGTPVPDLTLTLLDGTPLRLADLRGRVVVLNFWASWCRPCREEMPLLQRFHEAAQASGEATTVVGVGIRTDVDADARAFVADLGLTFPIGRDRGGEGGGVGPIEAALGLPSLYPATVFVRPDGTIARYYPGPLTEAQLRSAVDEARGG